MRVQFVQKDSGGVLSHTMADLPASGARWDASPAPTVTLIDASGGSILASTAATALSSTSTSASVDAGATAISVVTTTGMARWDQWLLGPNASGQFEWVILDAINATTHAVTVVDPLLYTYGSSTVIKSHTLTYTVNASTAGSIARDCRAEWSYAVASIGRKESTIFHVSLYAPRRGVTAADFLQIEPRALKLVGSNQRLDLLLKHIWESRVLPDIGKVVPHGGLQSGSAADDCLILATQAHLSMKAKEVEISEEYGRRYGQALEELRATALDPDEDGAKDDEEAVRSVFTPRLLRG